MNTILKTLSIVIALFSCNPLINAQDAELLKKTNQWFKSQTYLDGLALKPFEGVNKVEFYIQYQKNKDLLDKAFSYLKNTNLDIISVGKHVIDGDSVFASVTENPTKSFEDTKWEFHKKYIDIQYVIKGKEKMGTTPVESLSITTPYNETKDVGFGDASNGKFYIAEPGTFLIFLPSDAHRPNIRIKGFEKTKKIVVKILAK